MNLLLRFGKAVQPRRGHAPLELRTRYQNIHEEAQDIHP